ncbi:hypothetical protein SUGI_1222840 [Cryptomeria japonica]|uniref:Uncharacterized protein n=1 Tax=Cryptomeria japonica TaxID=3369 RepID=A0AAD3RPA2_CRYJA|nr:hypothetical protein SUGI_1222840 [Cryptomeria japonica]
MCSIESSTEMAAFQTGALPTNSREVRVSSSENRDNNSLKLTVLVLPPADSTGGSIVNTGGGGHEKRSLLSGRWGQQESEQEQGSLGQSSLYSCLLPPTAYSHLSLPASSISNRYLKQGGRSGQNYNNSGGPIRARLMGLSQLKSGPLFTIHPKETKAGCLAHACKQQHRSARHRVQFRDSGKRTRKERRKLASILGWNSYPGGVGGLIDRFKGILLVECPGWSNSTKWGPPPSPTEINDYPIVDADSRAPFTILGNGEISLGSLAFTNIRTAEVQDGEQSNEGDGLANSTCPNVKGFPQGPRLINHLSISQKSGSYDWQTDPTAQNSRALLSGGSHARTSFHPVRAQRPEIVRTGVNLFPVTFFPTLQPTLPTGGATQPSPLHGGLPVGDAPVK